MFFFNNFNPTDVFRISARNLKTYNFSMLDEQRFNTIRTEILEYSSEVVKSLPPAMVNDVLSIYGNFIKYLRFYNSL